MADIKKLNIARGAVQHKVTNIKKFFENKADGEVVVVVDVEALRNRLVLLETCYKDFNEIHSKVLIEIVDEDAATITAALEKDEVFQELYLEVKSLLTNALKVLIPEPVTGGSVPCNNRTAGSHHAVKLPTIILPTFDGAYEK